MGRGLKVALLGCSMGLVLGCEDEVVVVDDDGPSETDTDTGTGTGGPTATGSDMDTGTGTGTGTGTETEACLSKAKADCLSCCDETFAEGVPVMNELYEAECLCAPGQPCHPLCVDSVCEAQEPSAECDSCSGTVISQGGADCLSKTFKQCAEDDDCAPLGECRAGCYESATGTATGVNAECFSQSEAVCLNCCNDAYEPEIEIVFDLVNEWCFCAPGAPCHLACVDYCPGPNAPADSPCQACVDSILAASAESCFFLAFDQCAQQADCAPYAECLYGC